MTAMEKSGIGYAYDRAKNMQIITRGNYAFLVAVNSLEADSTTVPLFDSENKLVTEIINNPLPDQGRAGCMAAYIAKIRERF